MREREEAQKQCAACAHPKWGNAHGAERGAAAQIEQAKPNRSVTFPLEATTNPTRTPDPPHTHTSPLAASPQRGREKLRKKGFLKVLRTHKILKN